MGSILQCPPDRQGYLRALDAAYPTMADTTKAMMAAVKSKVDSRATGRTAIIQGIEAEEREIEWSLEGPVMPNMPPGPRMRMVNGLLTTSGAAGADQRRLNWRYSR
jgi:hypothetical protein